MPEAVRIRLALPTLYDAVVARFAADGTNAEQPFGWREPQKYKTVRARIVWVPGDPGGSAGAIKAARHPGQNPRSLSTLDELFTVHVSAFDPQFPEDERSNYRETRILYDAWYRAVYLAAHGTFEVQSLDWNVTKSERRHGTELVCVCAIEALIPDLPLALAPVDTEADIVTSLEDVDETTTTR